jgi:protein TonB
MARHGLRRYLTGSVPISIGLHLIALILCLVIPLTARIVLPMVSVDLPEYVRLAPMPPPPEVAVRTPPRGEVSAPSPNAHPAPTVAPSTIQPDDRSYSPLAGTSSPDASVGIPTGIGTAAETGIAPPAGPVSQTLPGPVRIADLPVPPRKTNDARPVYPDLARQARVEGTVVMEAVLDPSGRVTQLRVIQSVPLLDRAALDAVRQWRYTPSMYGGRPVSVLMTITMQFKLQ